MRFRKKAKQCALYTIPGFPPWLAVAPNGIGHPDSHGSD
jgi:hypothetical protein